MTYKQTITPNLDPYMWATVNGKYQMITDWLGWCMGYVYSAFANTQKNGTSKVKVNTAPSAHQGWLDSKYKHADKSFPAGVYFAIWFDWYGDIDGTGVKNWGHTAIMKDGKVWSSPLSHKPYADTFGSLDAIIKAFGGTIKYVGWSEDVCGTRVISPVAPPKPAPKPVITTKDVTTTKAVPFKTVTQNDDTLPEGQTKVVTAGVNGVETIVTTITYTDGKQTAQKVKSDTVTKQPVDQVTAVGTYVAPVAPAPLAPVTKTPTPPKVIVPEPHTYFTLWQLLVAFIKRLFGVK